MFQYRAFVRSVREFPHTLKIVIHGMGLVPAHYSLSLNAMSLQHSTFR